MADGDELLAFLDRMYVGMREKVDEAALEGNPKALTEHTYRLQGFESGIWFVKQFLGRVEDENG